MRGELRIPGKAGAEQRDQRCAADEHRLGLVFHVRNPLGHMPTARRFDQTVAMAGWRLCGSGGGPAL